MLFRGLDSSQLLLHTMQPIMGYRANRFFAASLLLSYVVCLIPTPLFAHACGFFHAGWGINEASAIVKGEILDKFPSDAPPLPGPDPTTQLRYVVIRVNRVIKGKVL